MGLWTLESVKQGKDWAEFNKLKICNEYLSGHSINHIQKILCPFPIGRWQIEKILKAASIPLKGMAQNGKEKQLEKVKSTSLKKFGVENASSSVLIKEKRTATVKKRYGVENIFQNENIKEKIAKNNLEKYGTTSPGPHALKNGFSNLTGKLSKPHQKLSTFLLANGIVHDNEVVVKYNKKALRVDIQLNHSKNVIEVFGDYYHANPVKYKKSDLISTFAGKITCEEIWKRDEKRLQILKGLGYNVLIIWECEIKNLSHYTLEKINAHFKNC